MTGSFIISYLDDIEFGGDYLDVSVNGSLKKRLYNYTQNLYSVPLGIGDVVTIQYVPIGGFTSNFDLIRKDYTPDNYNDDKGIKETIIASAETLTTYTFTATTINTAYDFEYVLTNGVISDYQIWTEASEPIMTQNDEYLNQQF